MALCQGAYILRFLDNHAPEELHSANLHVCHRFNFLDYTILELKEEIKQKLCHQWSECEYIEKEFVAFLKQISTIRFKSYLLFKNTIHHYLTKIRNLQEENKQLKAQMEELQQQLKSLQQQQQQKQE